jgi:hypothetical protein
MAVDRDQRLEIAVLLAQLMRGEACLRDVRSLHKRLSPSREAVTDRLAEHALTRLEKHWSGSSGRRPIAATELQWAKLKRWIAILHTDIDWTLPRSTVTIGGMILATYIFNGTPLIVWLVIGCIAAPVMWVYIVLKPERPSAEDLRSPFDTVDQLNAAMPFADTCDLPEYDPLRHGAKSVTFLRFFEFLAMSPIFLLLLLFAIAMWPYLLIGLWLDRVEENAES